MNFKHKKRVFRLGIRVLLASIVTALFFNTSSISVNLPENDSQAQIIESKTLDARAEVLRDYLSRFDSPLQNHAQDFVDAADSESIDWKWVAAIAGVESTFGKQVPEGYSQNSSFNGWGWNVYGGHSHDFKSWTDGIFTVTEGLSQNYIKKGLTDPYSMNKVYAASPTWGMKVSYFLNDIDRFAAKRRTLAEANLPIVQYTNLEYKTAGMSAKLTKNL